MAFNSEMPARFSAYFSLYSLILEIVVAPLFKVESTRKPEFLELEPWHILPASSIVIVSETFCFFS